MQIAIPLFDDFTALDAVGPYEVLSRLPGAKVAFVAEEVGPKRTETGIVSLNVEHTLDEFPEPENVVVPGGIGTRAALANEPLVGWIRHAHEASQWTTSVSTGSLLLGAAGILDGLEATSHWLALPLLEHFGARPTQRRVVEQGKVITAAGVSSGIDMALTLAARLAGDDVAKAIQLGIEYDPEPPFDSGSPAKAPEHVVELARSAQAAEAAARGVG